MRKGNKNGQKKKPANKNLSPSWLPQSDAAWVFRGELVFGSKIIDMVTEKLTSLILKWVLFNFVKKFKFYKIQCKMTYLQVDFGLKAVWFSHRKPMTTYPTSISNKQSSASRISNNSQMGMRNKLSVNPNTALIM